MLAEPGLIGPSSPCLWDETSFVALAAPSAEAAMTSFVEIKHDGASSLRKIIVPFGLLSKG